MNEVLSEILIIMLHDARECLSKELYSARLILTRRKDRFRQKPQTFSFLHGYYIDEIAVHTMAYGQFRRSLTQLVPFGLAVKN